LMCARRWMFLWQSEAASTMSTDHTAPLQMRALMITDNRESFVSTLAISCSPAAGIYDIYFPRIQ
jgi:hypothetical protein